VASRKERLGRRSSQQRDSYAQSTPQMSWDLSSRCYCCVIVTENSPHLSNRFHITTAKSVPSKRPRKRDTQRNILQIQLFQKSHSVPLRQTEWSPSSFLPTSDNNAVSAGKAHKLRRNWWTLFIETAGSWCNSCRRLLLVLLVLCRWEDTTQRHLSPPPFLSLPTLPTPLAFGL
jgi:hypothetical protein